MLIPQLRLTPARKTVLGAVVVFGLVLVGALIVFAVATLRSEPGLLLFVVSACLVVAGVLSVGLSYRCGPLELTFSEGVLQERRKLLLLHRERELLLPSGARVEFVTPSDTEAPPGARQAPPSWTPLRLRYEGGELTFGSFLSTQEKRWLHQRINDFLERQGTPEE